MKNKNILSDYEITKSTLNHPLVEYSPLQYLIKTRYLLSLKKNENKRSKLDFDKKLAAEFNSVPTSMISTYICRKVIEEDENVFKLMKKETQRLDNTTKEYNSKKLTEMPRQKMEYLLKGIIEDKNLEKMLNDLYYFETKQKENKIIKFRVKKTRVTK